MAGLPPLKAISLAGNCVNPCPILNKPLEHRPGLSSGKFLVLYAMDPLLDF